MKKLLFSMVALAGLVMASCSSDPAQELAPAGKNEAKVISLQASMADFTRATDTAFEEGDKIGLYIFTNETYLNNVAYTFAANAFTAATEQVWYEDETLQSQVVAYYPYAASAAADTHTFTVASTQTSAAAYTASDLMVASTTATPTENAINLPFKHMLSKVNLTVVDENNDPVKSVYFVDVAGTVTYEVKNAAQTLAASGTTTIQATKQADGTYTLIMAPQTVAPTLAITTESGAQYNFKVDNAVTFKSGTVSTASVTIEKQEEPLPPTPPTPDPIAITISWEIADWVAGEELNFVQSEEEVVVESYKFYTDVTATGWTNVNIYMWDTTATISADWPGTAISTEEVDGKTYYVYDATALKGKTISVIFNNGAEQTVDLNNVFVDNDLFFTLTSKNGEGKWEAKVDGLLTPDQPSTGVTIPADVTLGVVGDHTSWSSDSLMALENGVYVAKAVALEAGKGFKVRKAGEWNDAYNFGPSAATEIAVNGSLDVVNGSGAQNILVPATGNYDVYFDNKALKVWLMEVGKTPAN